MWYVTFYQGQPECLEVVWYQRFLLPAAVFHCYAKPQHVQNSGVRARKDFCATDLAVTIAVVLLAYSRCLKVV